MIQMVGMGTSDHSDEYNNLYSMIDDMRFIRDDTTDFHKDYNKFVSSSPFHVIVDNFDDKFSGMAGAGTNNRSMLSATLLPDDRAFLTKLVQSIDFAGSEIADSLDDVSDSMDSVDRAVSNIKKDTSSIKTTSASSNASTILKSIGSALLSLSGVVINTASQRITSDIEGMIESRNDLMYQYGLTDPKQADELYKLQFQHQALPYQRRTAFEWREFERENRKTAIDMGFNTEKSVHSITNELNKWQDIFEDINLAQSDMFRTTMRFVDNTGKATDAILSQIRETATNYIVTPDLLEEVSSSYARYLRVITKNNTAYTRSMDNLIKTVGRLEDAGVDSMDFFSQIQDFQYQDLANASNSDMWTRLSVLGLSPYEVLTQMSSDEALDAYTSKLKSYFSGYDLSNGQDRLMVNTIAQQVLGFNSSEMQNLYDLLLSKPSEGAVATENGSYVDSIDDYTSKIAIDAASYYDQQSARWTYLTEAQKRSDEITLGILNNDYLVGAYEWWDKMFGGILDINTAISTATSFLIGGGLLSLIKTIFEGLGGVDSGGLLGRLLGKGATNGAGGAAGGGIAASTLLGAGMTAAGLAWAGYNGYQGLQLSTDWLGEERGSSTSGKVSSLLGGILGGTGPGWYDEDASNEDKIKNTLGNVGKFGLTGAGIGTLIAPGVGTAIGAGVGSLVGVLTSIPSGEEIANKLKDAWDYCKTWGIQAWDEIKPHAEALWDDTKVLASTTWEDIKSFASTFWDFATGEGDTSWEDVKLSANDWWENLKTNIGSWWEDFKTTADVTMGEVFEFFGADWDQFKLDVSAGWEDIKNWGIDAFNTAIGAADLAGEAVFGEQRWSDIKGWVNGAFEDLGVFFSETIPQAWDSFTEKVTQWWDDLNEWYENSWLKDVIDWTGDKLEKGAEWVGEKATNAWNTTTGVGEKAINAWNTTTEWVGDKATNAWNDITDFFGRAVNRGEEITGLHSHASGLTYVPYDNYFARLHKGEAVLTANENRSYQNNQVSVTTDYKESLELTEDSNKLADTNNSLISKIIDQFKNSTTGNMFSNLLNNNKLSEAGNKISDILNTSIRKSDSTTGTNNTLLTTNNSNISNLTSSISGSGGLTFVIGKLKLASENVTSFFSDLFQKDTKTGGFLLNLTGLVGMDNENSGDGNLPYNPFSNYRVTSPYGMRVHPITGVQKMHTGTDYGVPNGTSLPALDSGKVVTSAYNAGGYGNYIDVLGDNGYKYRYAHMSRHDLNVGDVVNKGQSIGLSGNTGASTEARSKIIKFAQSKLGTPYVWGAAGPNYYDCSGFVSAALNTAGLGVGRITTSEMRNNVQSITSVDQLIPGDVVMGNSGKHTGIYIGNNTIIHSSGGSKNTVSNPGKGVTTDTWRPYWYAKWLGLGTYGDGGLISKPTLALMGEEGYNEYVISTDPKKVNQSTALLNQAANDIGVVSLSTPEEIPSVTEVYVDTDGIIDAVEKLSKIVQKGFELFTKNSEAHDQSVPAGSNSITDYV